MRTLSLSLTVVLISSGVAFADLRTVMVAPVPVILDFNVTVDGGTVADQRRAVATDLIAAFDENGDEKLSQEEADGLNPLPGGRGLTVESIWDRVDTDPADEQLNAAEVHALIDAAVGADIVLEKVEGRPQNELSLESFLDADGNGRIEPHEYKIGFAELRRVDFDDDDTLSAAELIAFAKAAESSGEQPMPISAATKTGLPEQLAELAKAEFNLSWQQRRIQEMDGNDDGTVTAEEAANWVETAEADLEVRLDIAPITGNRLQLNLGDSRLRPVRPERRRRSRSRANASVGAKPAQTDIEFRVTKNFTAADSLSFMRLQHLKSDDDQNGYLSSGEYNGAFDSKPGTYDELDRDGDKMLTVEELENFVTSKQRLAQLQVKLSVENVSQSLFEQIDRDVDQRLAPREIAMLSGTDRAADLTASSYRVVAETDEIAFITNNMEAQMAANAIPVVRETSNGPEWFRKMDRNRDGDLIWREFLGPRDAFDTLDADGDGFVTVSELP